MSLIVTEIISRSEQGATLPFRCRCNDGELYFLKGKFAGLKSLVCEWTAGRLAQIAGLPTPEIAIAEVPRDLIAGSSRRDAEDLGEGFVFASRLVEDAQELNFSMVENIPNRLQRWVLLFDWWVHNEDRTLTRFGGNPNLLISNDQTLRVFDFNLAFDESFDSVRFWQMHVFRETASTGWDLAFRPMRKAFC